MVMCGSVLFLAGRLRMCLLGRVVHLLLVCVVIRCRLLYGSLILMAFYRPCRDDKLTMWCLLVSWLCLNR